MKTKHTRHETDTQRERRREREREAKKTPKQQKNKIGEETRNERKSNRTFQSISNIAISSLSLYHRN